MPHYRITIRYGEPRRRYEVLDVDASDLRAALAESVERFPDAALETGDLVEIRQQALEEEREYGPG